VKYVKKRIEVEAEQWFPGREVEGVEEFYDPKPDIHLPYPVVHTPNGPVRIEPGEWIITGAAGEKYPCKAHIFEATYEVAVEDMGYFRCYVCGTPAPGEANCPYCRALRERDAARSKLEAAEGELEATRMRNAFLEQGDYVKMLRRAEAAEAKVAELTRHLDNAFKTSDRIDDRAEASEAVVDRIRALALSWMNVPKDADYHDDVVDNWSQGWVQTYLSFGEELFRALDSETGEWADKPLPEDEEIKAAHPLHTNRHGLYAEAMRLVGAKRSKNGLVNLVTWLLTRLAVADARAHVERDALQLACDVVGAMVEGNPKVTPEELPRWLASFLATSREVDAERGAVIRALTIELQAARARLGEEVTVVMTTAATTAEVPSQQVSWPRPFADVVVEEFEADPKESIEQLDAYVTAKYGFQGTEPGQAVVAATDEVVTMCKMTFYGLPCTLREGHEGACTPDDSWRPRSPT